MTLPEYNVDSNPYENTILSDAGLQLSALYPNGIHPNMLEMFDGQRLWAISGECEPVILDHGPQLRKIPHIPLTVRLGDLVKSHFESMFPLIRRKLSDKSEFRLISICNEKNTFIVLIIACAQASRSSHWLDSIKLLGEY